MPCGAIVIAKECRANLSVDRHLINVPDSVKLWLGTPAAKLRPRLNRAIQSVAGEIQAKNNLHRYRNTIAARLLEKRRFLRWRCLTLREKEIEQAARIGREQESDNKIR